LVYFETDKPQKDQLKVVKHPISGGDGFFYYTYPSGMDFQEKCFPMVVISKSLIMMELTESLKLRKAASLKHHMYEKITLMINN